MTPIPIDLPLLPSEALELASLVFSLAEHKTLNEEVRNRVAGRAAVLSLGSLRPYPGSLERDAVHHSTYYLAVDGAAGEPLLLHIATGGAPTGSLFAKALLIGRTRQPNGSELVVNAVPFGPADHQNLEKFTAQIGAALLPRPQGSRTALASPSTTSFETFRAVFKATRKNLAALAAPPDAAIVDFYYAGLWSAIRAGWREGYTIGIAVHVADDATARETIRQAAPFSRFALDVAALVAPQGDAETRYTPALAAAEKYYDLMRQTRSARKISRPFDFELDLSAGPVPTTAADLLFCLNWLKSRGKPAQLFAPSAGADLPELAAAARTCQCLLTLDARAGTPEQIARATMGRVNYLAGSEDLATLAEKLFA